MGALPSFGRRRLLAAAAATGVAGAAAGWPSAAHGAGPTISRITDLGAAVTGLNFGNGSLVGRELWLGTGRMNPARVVAFDFDRGQVTRSVLLPGVAGVWGTEQLGTDLYVATYTPARLIRIDTITATIVDTINLSEEVAWNVKASPDGRLFVGTYPGAELWEYDPGSRTAVNHGTMKAGETYLRDLAATESTVYCGIGSHPDLIAFDRASGTRTSIMPAEFADEGFVAVLNISGSHLLAGATPRARVAVINTADPSDYSVIAVPNDEPYVTALYGAGDDVWVGTTKSNTIWHTTLTATSITPVAAGITGTLRMGHLDGNRLWTVQSGGASVLDLTTDELAPLPLLSEELQPDPQKPMTVHWADQRVFVPGSGVMAIHGDASGSSQPQVRTIATLGEAKALDSHEGALLAGIYTLALVGRMPTSGDQLDIVARVAKEHEQTRPLDIAIDRDTDRLLMGTEPDYGKWEGAFSWVGLADARVTTHRGILPDQSVAAVCPSPGGVWLGGSVRNGYGTTPTRTTAQLARFDWSSGRLSAVAEPFPGTYAFVDLQRHGDLLLALTNAGLLHALDGRSLRPVWTVKVGRSGGRTTWLGSRLVGTDGDRIWAVRLVARRPPTVEVLHTGLAAQWFGEPTIASDGIGALFTLQGLHLVRFDVARP